ncbi:transposase, partial [Paucibacter sp. PLA-PC-4]|uniref:transposase n=1 Tax=Paucibacter sp. PLA-PC-4 TaxID=2993655 RepID=UPI002249207F
MTQLTGLQIDTMNTRILLSPGHPLALCWRYCRSHLEEEQVQVHTANGALRELMVAWAVGVLADGDWEALGAGPGAAVGRAFWRYVWEDLDRRGVDKMSLLCASDVDAQTVCPVIKVLQPFRQVLGQSSAAATSSVGVLRAEARPAVREASGVRAARTAQERLLAGPGAGRAVVSSPKRPEVLAQLRHGLRRAVARHGPFADVAAAVSFVSQTLSRDELRLKFSKLSG